MTHRMLSRFQPVCRLGALALFSMMCIFSRPSLAISAFTPQNQPTGYIAQDTVTNGTLTSGNEILFRPEYEKQYWSGNLYAYPISALGVVDTSGELWSGGVAPHVEAQNFSTGRYIGTMKDDGTKVPFLSTSLSASQQTTLASVVNSVSYTSTQIVNYLRGDHTNESASALRQRLTPNSTTTTVLGDIVHSKPYYLSDATNPTIFVGSNDGMLHAFNTADGTERWAYVPSMLISKMKSLAGNPFTHDYFVDGSVTVGDAVATSTGTNTRILVGGLGAGGRGLYALNIDGASGLTASSDQTAANKVIWEITPTAVNFATPQMYGGTGNASAYSNLGYTYSIPVIKTINNGGTPQQVVIVGNGYNNNNGGDYQAYLYVINAIDGKLVRAIKADSTATNTTGAAVTDGTSTSPNGLMNLVAFDSNFDGYTDRVYAGDLNGTMWKFDLSSPTPASWAARVLQVTSPAQPITATPDAIANPAGGFVVNFATGSIFTGTQPGTGTGATGDLSDTSTFYVYGIWDGAPSTNTTLTNPVLTERCYNTAGNPSAPPCPSDQIRVRRLSSAPPNWAAGGDKGWQIALPIGGERVVGEGSFISSGRYYMSTYNPTISYLVPTTTTYEWGEIWQMALDSLLGGSTTPFMDLDANGIVNNNDRIMYTATDPQVVANTTTAGTAITSPNEDGIEVGKWVGRGVASQPTLVKLSNLYTTLFDMNPDVSFPPPSTATGVNGGHFDVDIYYGNVTASAAATATITVGSTGSTRPATLGGIKVNGVTIVPALTTSDLTNGSAAATNATVIKNKVTGVYTASVSGSTITLTAPIGSSYNGQAITILTGSSSGTLGTVPASGNLVMTGVGKNKTVSIQCGSTYIGSSGSFTSSNSNTASTRLNALYSTLNGSSVNGYSMACTASPSSAPTSVTCTVSAPAGVSACSSGFTVNSNITVTTNTGPSGGTNPTGWSDLSPVLYTSTFSGGADGAAAGDTCTSGCYRKTHVHQYDKIYDVTGLNMLNPNDLNFILSLPLPNTQQKFKVIMHNQYLNPAAKLHIGDPSYLPNIDYGYVSVKNYTTSTTLDLTTLPTYVEDSTATGDGLSSGPKFIGSLVLNVPADALTSKNWWGNGDVRAGLIPVSPSCVYQAAGSHDGNMYKPIIAPANNILTGYPGNGPGTDGWSNSTTPGTAIGVRHGGALTIQIIKDTTPATDLELNDSLGRPEYGWRVKSPKYSADVLAEYNMYWHHPTNYCFDNANWVKNALTETPITLSPTPRAGATDPKIGNLQGSSGTVASVTKSGNTTTVTYTDGSVDIVQVITNPNGTTTTVTTHLPTGVTGTVSSVVNTDGTITTTYTINGTSGTATAAAGVSVTLPNGATVSNNTNADYKGSTGYGGLLNQNAIGYRRIYWKELIRK